jgi:hypothetical protein
MEKNNVRDRLFKVISNFSESQKGNNLHDSEEWKQPEATDKQKSKFLEKREHIRKDTSVYVICETKNANFRDFTKNVSEGGILIEPETTLSLHEDISMTLFEKIFNSPVRTNGKVVRVDPDGVGVQFDQVIPGMSSL